MPTEKLKAFLDQNGVRYVTIRHSMAYTSQEVAASAHVSGREFAKTVVFRIDDKMALAVLPAAYQVDFDQLSQYFRGKRLSLATEAEFRDRFPGCEPGAMPPFGNLYGLEVYVAETLSAEKEIAFNAGTHTEIIRMAFADFERLVHPVVLRFSWKSAALPRDPDERWAEEL
ncbi:MAG: YbaK/EbsC family protein [Prolixibacteraceae bacterium]|jgi:Ala-tRNA(Pro) deacylase|nr:YbaK/EbsC family protein [Prolixibacteraceae bacterium]HPJ77758.1 YbaK/EbsC family protein [Prolixibacteraceae bacterium]HRV90209.1 YbaK/EbsC family protein [Prolixibacteraceae bacterium]